MLKENISNLLVVRTDRFGEFILNIPAIRALRDTFRNAKISVLVSGEVKGLMAASSLVDDFISCDELPLRGAFFRSLKLALWLRRKGFDSIVILNPSKQFNIASFLVNIKVRVGYDRKWGILLNYKIADRKYEAKKHEVLYNLELVNLIGAHTDDLSITIPLSYQSRIYIDSLFERFGITPQDRKIAIHPFTSDPRKQWKIENFKKVARLLCDRYNVKIFIIGGRDEVSVWRPFNFKNKRIFDLVGRLSLAESCALLKECLLLISCDSGPVHLACSQGIKTCVLFRNDLPGKDALRWGPWGKGHIVIEESPLDNITPQRVLDTVAHLLSSDAVTR